MPQERKFNDTVVDQIVHFFEKDGKNMRNVLEIAVEPPILSDKGYPKGGEIILRLKREEGTSAMKLNAGEASLLAETLKMTVNEIQQQKALLWQKR